MNSITLSTRFLILLLYRTGPAPRGTDFAPLVLLLQSRRGLQGSLLPGRGVAWVWPLGAVRRAPAGREQGGNGGKAGVGLVTVRGGWGASGGGERCLQSEYITIIHVSLGSQSCSHPARITQYPCEETLLAWILPTVGSLANQPHIYSSSARQLFPCG